MSGVERIRIRYKIYQNDQNNLTMRDCRDWWSLFVCIPFVTYLRQQNKYIQGGIQMDTTAINIKKIGYDEVW